MPHRTFIVTEKEVLEIVWSVIFVGRIIWKLNQQDQNMCSLPSSRRIHGRRTRGLAIRFRVPRGRRSQVKRQVIFAYCRSRNREDDYGTEQ
jgi:hypothetical protein